MPRRIVALVIFLFVFSGCGKFAPCSEKELLRITSPDGKVDAVLVKGDCGATTSYSYDIFIVPRGESTKKTKAVFKADHVKNESLQWLAPKILEVKYGRYGVRLAYGHLEA